MTNEEFLEFINKADRADIDISPEGVWGHVSISTDVLRKLVENHTNQRVIEELEQIHFGWDLEMPYGMRKWIEERLEDLKQK